MLFLTTCSIWSQTEWPVAIADNSFLLEEAYNQEFRVVQHISNFMYSNKTKDWEYAFSQEWPVWGQAHQLSYTIPYSFIDQRSTKGVGDIAINYRYQALTEEKGLAFSPRISVIIPSGNEDKNLGNGRTGYQLNLPASKRLDRNWVMHFNAGAGATPGMKVGTGKKTLWDFTIAGSLIWLLHPNFNVMTELIHIESDEIVSDKVKRSGTTILNPGLRYAYNAGSLQIVPGFSIPIQLNDKKETQMFFYLSFEHPF